MIKGFHIFISMNWDNNLKKKKILLTDAVNKLIQMFQKSGGNKKNWCYTHILLVLVIHLCLCVLGAEC